MKAHPVTVDLPTFVSNYLYMEIDVRVIGKRLYAVRVWLAGRILRLFAWILNMNVKINLIELGASDGNQNN